MNVMRPLAVALLAASAAGLSACSSSSHVTAPTSVPAPTQSATSAQPSLVISPAEPLQSPATVQVTATGFSPGESLVVAECANKGTSTSEADCNLAGIKAVTANSSGAVHTTFTVTKGPFGTNHITCDQPDSCLVSVTQPTPNPTQDATAPLTFTTQATH
ncbi:MAG TPA: neocarzinostatin apoprotein domain-containing protein [Acidimicrobiales bacterium]|nr:neocarzinostatin apoprotein domain-containing protein [Acidimicrobiales bacterium]